MSQEFSSYESIENYNTFVSEQRYSFARVEVNGQEAFLKQANTAEVAPKLQRELLWNEYMGDFARSYPELRVRSPAVISLHERRIIFEYVEAPFLGTVDNMSALESEIPRLANLLLAMDALGAEWKPVRAVDAATDNAPWHDIGKSWPRWAASPIGAAVINHERLAIATGILNEYGHRLTPRMQHGDFNPWHIFNKDGEWIIFDGENASVEKPRFYDLAYFYSRVFSRGKNHEVPAKLLTEFIAGIDMPQQEFFESFLPLLTSRALGIFMDAAHDSRKVDYMADTVELFERCSSKQLSALTAL